MKQISSFSIPIILVVAFFTIYATLFPFSSAKAEEADDSLNTNVSTQRDRVSGETGNIGDTSSPDFRKQQELSRQLNTSTGSTGSSPQSAIDIDQFVVNFKCGWFDVVCGGLQVINWVLNQFGYVLAQLTGGLLNMAIEYNKTDFIGNIAGVRAGWTIARDTANLFFIIILIVVAIATIFDLQSFNAKAILPKLILIALLINFSFAIGAFIILQSNNLASVFYNRLVPLNGSLANELEKGVNYRITEKEIRGTLSKVSGNDARKIIDKVETPIYTSVEGINVEGEYVNSDKCQRLNEYRDAINYRAIQAACEQWRVDIMKELTKTTDIYAQLGISIVAKIFVYPIAAFVFVAGAVMLLGRAVSLMFLLILAPLAFISYLLPGRANQWGSWWGKLFNHAFFFPIFIFCLMLSLLILQEIAKTPGPGQNILISYGLGVAFMIGALIVAKQMGAAGAGAAIGIGNKVRGWAQTKAKNVGWRAGGLASKATLEGLKETGLLDTKLGRVATTPVTRGLEYAAGRRQKLADEREKARLERTRTAVSAVSPEYAATRLRTASQSDFEEFVDKAKPGEIAKAFAHLSAQEIRERVSQFKDAKKQEKAYSAIPDLDKRVAAQTETSSTAYVEEQRKQIDQKRKDGHQEGADKQEEALEERHVIDTAQVISSMSAEDRKKIPDSELDKAHVRRAIEIALASNATVMRDLGNTEIKSNKIREILVQASGAKPDIDLTAPVDLTIKTARGTIAASNDDIRNTVNRIENNISLNEDEKKRKMEQHFSEIFHNMAANAVAAPELQRHVGTKGYKDALKNYTERRVKEIRRAIERGETNMEQVVANLRNSQNPGHRAAATMLDSNPSMRVSIAHGLPLSERLAPAFAQAAEAGAGGTAPPAPPPPNP